MPVAEPFSIDAADERGFSALMAAAYAIQPETLRLLLDNGADVNAVDEPGGYSALDLVLSRARADLKETGPEGIDGHLLRIIDLLKTANPAPTIHPAYRAELLARDKWKLGARLTAFWPAVRERVLPLQPRPAVTIDCETEGIAKHSLGLDVPPAN